MYINTETLEYPLYEGDIRLRFSDISFPSIGFEPPPPYARVEEVDAPTNLTRTQRLKLGVPKLTKDVWYQTWEIVEISKEENDAEIENAIYTKREYRNGLLAKSDWTQLADSPLTAEKKLEWAAYRQSLRDFDYRTDPFNLTWPVEPTK